MTEKNTGKKVRGRVREKVREKSTGKYEKKSTGKYGKKMRESTIKKMYGKIKQWKNHVTSGDVTSGQAYALVRSSSIIRKYYFVHAHILLTGIQKCLLENTPTENSKYMCMLSNKPRVFKRC
jgi:hypothetical protein